MASTRSKSKSQRAVGGPADDARCRRAGSRARGHGRAEIVVRQPQRRRRTPRPIGVARRVVAVTSSSWDSRSEPTIRHTRSSRPVTADASTVTATGPGSPTCVRAADRLRPCPDRVLGAGDRADPVAVVDAVGQPGVRERRAGDGGHVAAAVLQDRPRLAVRARCARSRTRPRLAPAPSSADVPGTAARRARPRARAARAHRRRLPCPSAAGRSAAPSPRAAWRFGAPAVCPASLALACAAALSCVLLRASRSCAGSPARRAARTDCRGASGSAIRSSSS